MKSIRPYAALKDPFPTGDLDKLDFGNADGHRDKYTYDALIETASIKNFYNDNHSIIVGEIGTGKSTLFKLLKSHSSRLEAYKEHLIVPIEEAISFVELNKLILDHYEDRDPLLVYQLLWKFNILSKTAVELAKQDSFPQSEDEKLLNEFLRHSCNHETSLSILDKIKKVTKSIKFEARIGDHFITLGPSSTKPKIKINLESIQTLINNVLVERKITKATIIIDKIDKFVSGIAYQIQRDFISALLEVEDDFAHHERLNLKIFIRADLFNRLNFSSLGYDKVNDNSIFLKWSKEETLRFLATRIMVALKNAGIASFEQLLASTDLGDYGLRRRDKLILSPITPEFLKKLLRKKLKNERSLSLIGRFDQAVITKLFPRECLHYCNNEKQHVEISIFDFLYGHFLDGNGVCTPRYMLVFLKEVKHKTIDYYDNNPDQHSDLLPVGNDYEWNLFKKRTIYEAYISAKEIYIRTIVSTENRWVGIFEDLLSKKGNKTQITFKWLKANMLGISDSDAEGFLIFLQVIGFLKIHEMNTDVKKRVYELPILFKVSPPQPIN